MAPRRNARKSQPTTTTAGHPDTELNVLQDAAGAAHPEGAAVAQSEAAATAANESPCPTPPVESVGEPIVPEDVHVEAQDRTTPPHAEDVVTPVAGSPPPPAPFNTAEATPTAGMVGRSVSSDECAAPSTIHAPPSERSLTDTPVHVVSGSAQTPEKEGRCSEQQDGAPASTLATLRRNADTALAIVFASTVWIFARAVVVAAVVFVVVQAVRALTAVQRRFPARYEQAQAVATGAFEAGKARADRFELCREVQASVARLATSGPQAVIEKLPEPFDRVAFEAFALVRDFHRELTTSLREAKQRQN